MEDTARILSDTRIAILAADGFEQSELEVPLERLHGHGADVEVVSLEEGMIRGWRDGEWGRSVEVDQVLANTQAERYAGLVIPGGRQSPDVLRAEPLAVAFLRDFALTQKPIAAICHGPWLLAEADLLRGRELTSYASIRTDLVNAGGRWLDQPVVVDMNLITSRSPADLDAFCEALISRLAGKASLAAAE